MNEYHIIDFLATEVLGWYEHCEDADSPCEWYKDADMIASSSWNPYRSMEEAWQLLEHFDEGLVRKRFGKDNYRARLQKYRREVVAHGKTPQEAIVNTVLKFYGYNEEK